MPGSTHGCAGGQRSNRASPGTEGTDIKTRALTRILRRTWDFLHSRQGLAVLKAAAMPVAVIVGGLLVMGGSQAAFSGSTESNNSWKAATVALTSNKSTAMFNVAAMKPGTTESHCITVTSASDIPTEVRMYSGGVGGTNGLNTYLSMAIDAGSGGTDGATSCTGFTATASLFNGLASDFAAATNFATALPGQALAPGAGQQYRISVTLLTTAPNSAQGGQSSIKFVWENQ